MSEETVCHLYWKTDFEFAASENSFVFAPFKRFRSGIKYVQTFCNYKMHDIKIINSGKSILINFW